MAKNDMESSSICWSFYRNEGHSYFLLNANATISSKPRVGNLFTNRFLAATMGHCSSPLRLLLTPVTLITLITKCHGQQSAVVNLVARKAGAAVARALLTIWLLDMLIPVLEASVSPSGCCRLDQILVDQIQFFCNLVANFFATRLPNPMS